jgi:uncharacterized membrane protein YfhO
MGNNVKNNYSITSTSYQNLSANYNSLSTGTIQLPFNIKNIVGIVPSSKKIDIKIPN